METKSGAHITCSICKLVAINKIGICYDCQENLKYSKITDQLYLSNFNHSQKYGDLQKLGIKQILVVGDEMLHRTEEFKTKYILIDDCAHQNIAQHFSDAHEFLKQDVTVVHCYAGISRSPTIVISYLMKEHGMKLAEALDLCKQIRPIVNPNDGFIAQLVEYERQLFLDNRSPVVVSN